MQTPHCRSGWWWSCLMAGLVMLPLSSTAQQPTSPDDGTAPAQQHSDTVGPAAADRHLSEAEQQVKLLPSVQKKDAAAKMLSDLRQHFDQMKNAYAQRGNAVGPPISLQATEDAKNELNWKEKFSEVENDLARLIGAGEELNQLRLQVELFFTAATSEYSN